MDKLNQELSLSEVKDLWLNKVWNSGEAFNLYIHNPFCPSICSFCMHAGTVSRINSEEYKRYYFEYLPNLIHEFSDIMKARVADTVYFGGGTASLMTEEVMTHIFESIPHFREIKNKVFEGHPISMTTKKVDILTDYNFSYMTFGTQTFNREILEAQNRIPTKEEPFKKIVTHAQSKGLSVAVDLLAFIRGKAEQEDFDLLRNDLTILMKEIGPHTITIYPLRQVFIARDLHTPVERTVEEKRILVEKGIDLAIEIRKFIKEFLVEYPSYQSMSNLSTDRSNFGNYTMNYFLSTLDSKEFWSTHSYSASGFPNNPEHQNVLALGGMYHDRPYSYHNRSICYVQQNDNWTPRFFVV